jgi:hypothetical protein
MATPTFYVVHVSHTREVGSERVSEGWVVCRGQFGKVQEIVSKGLYAEWADARRLTDQHAPKD